MGFYSLKINVTKSFRLFQNINYGVIIFYIYGSEKCIITFYWYVFQLVIDFKESIDEEGGALRQRQ